MNLLCVSDLFTECWQSTLFQLVLVMIVAVCSPCVIL